MAALAEGSSGTEGDHRLRGARSHLIAFTCTAPNAFNYRIPSDAYLALLLRKLCLVVHVWGSWS